MLLQYVYLLKVQHYNILFIDNPVGTGFSYVNNSDALATDLPQIATDLLVCIKHFYQKLPEFTDTATYIVGESYGGKYTVELAKIWYEVSTILYSICTYT